MQRRAATGGQTSGSFKVKSKNKNEPEKIPHGARIPVSLRILSKGAAIDNCFLAIQTYAFYQPKATYIHGGRPCRPQACQIPARVLRS